MGGRVRGGIDLPSPSVPVTRRDAIIRPRAAMSAGARAAVSSPHSCPAPRLLHGAAHPARLTGGSSDRGARRRGVLVPGWQPML